MVCGQLDSVENHKSAMQYFHMILKPFYPLSFLATTESRCRHAKRHNFYTNKFYATITLTEKVRKL